MLLPFFPALKTIKSPVKNRFVPERTNHGRNRWKYTYCPVAGGNAAVVITPLHSFCS